MYLCHVDGKALRSHTPSIASPKTGGNRGTEQSSRMVISTEVPGPTHHHSDSLSLPSPTGPMVLKDASTGQVKGEADRHGPSPAKAHLAW